MTKLEFQQLNFEESEDKLKVSFQNLYYFYIPYSDLRKIGEFQVSRNSITFNSPKDRAKRKLNMLIDKGFLTLKNKISSRSAFYIHKNSGIPLLGTIYFGIVDKGSSMLELKPLTSCNMNCTFCSVDEGILSTRLNDYIVEKEYLVDETKKILDYKKRGLDIYINPHGEPLLYPNIVELCNDLAKLKHTKSITIITTATLLSKPLIDSLSQNKKTKLNVSLHAIDEKLSKELFGTKGYNIKRVLEMLRYASKKLEIIIAPVLLANCNEIEIPKIIKFAKEIKAKILIQKFIKNKAGRNPKKEESWDSFYSKLDNLEKQSNVILKPELDKIEQTKTLPHPFKINQIIKATIVLPGRFKGEVLSSHSNRLISISNCHKTIGTQIKIKITKTKNGIFKANIVN
tara:strand:- start:1057 stop:2256 length:1200 start_codon:yes stop_codon:yes gene_type:complete